MSKTVRNTKAVLLNAVALPLYFAAQSRQFCLEMSRTLVFFKLGHVRNKESIRCW